MKADILLYTMIYQVVLQDVYTKSENNIKAIDDPTKFLKLDV